MNQKKDEPKKEDLAQKLAQVEKKAEEYLNGWKRAKADYINFKKETEKNRQEIIEYANANLLLDILPLVDQFKIAFAHLPGEQKDSDWIKGIRHLESKLKKILEDYGIIEISTSGKFNPELHEAIEHVESDQEEGTILETLSTGFKLGEKVIQPAKVKVAKKIIKSSQDSPNESCEEKGEK